MFLETITNAMQISLPVKTRTNGPTNNTHIHWFNDNLRAMRDYLDFLRHLNILYPTIITTEQIYNKTQE